MRKALLLASLMYTASYTPANAQAAAPADTADAEPTIGDIVVVARKTEERLQDVPISIKALSGDALQQASVHNVQDLQFSVPGFVEFPEGQGGAPDFAIRDAKQSGVSGSQGGVAVYLDYVPITSNFAIANSTYDLQSVQVLKGPQGTLFGKNTTGGAIIFTPNKPTDRFEGALTGGYGNYNRFDVNGMINLPIGEGVGLRVSGRYLHRDGYIAQPGVGPDSTQDAENSHSVRAILRIQPSSSFTSDTTFDYYQRHDIRLLPPAQFRECPAVQWCL